MDRAALSRLDDEAFLAALHGWLQAPDPRWIAGLVATARGDRSLARRAEAVRFLAFQEGRGWPRDAHRALDDALLDLAADRALWPPARAFALEGIANRSRGRCSPAVSEGIALGLRDWDPEVRFWACYAAWKANDQRAIPLLERLAQAPMVVPMLWSVHLEAQDALAALRGSPVDTQHPIVPVGTYQKLRRSAGRWPFEPLALLADLPGVETVLGFEQVGTRELLVDVEGDIDRAAGWQPVEDWQWRGWVTAWGERGMVTIQRVG